MFDWIRKFLDVRNDRCFEEHKNADGICYGLMGGDWSTDYLAETCVSCKHHTMYCGKNSKENDND